MARSRGCSDCRKVQDIPAEYEFNHIECQGGGTEVGTKLILTVTMDHSLPSYARMSARGEAGKGDSSTGNISHKRIFCESE